MTAPDPRVGEIEARLAAALHGPWEVAEDPMSEGDWMVRMVEYGPDEPDDVAAVISHEPTAEFIANAPSDVAYLLAELRKAHEALARVEALADKWEAGYGPGTRKEEVFGPQKVSIEFAVKSIRAAVAAANGDGQ